MSVVLVVNSGSSSFKYQLIDMSDESVLASGLVERIGEGIGHAHHTIYKADGEEVSFDVERPIPNHTVGFGVMLESFAVHGPSLAANGPVVVGHRVVHGGARFFQPEIVTPLIEINIDELSTLAPLHNPGALQGIQAAKDAFPDIPHVVVFDTAFHQTLPESAYSYAIDKKTADEHRIRKYGFHGTSHKYVSEEAARFLGRDLGNLKQIVFHLGNGASVSAIENGKSVDTSMGFTPLEGLVMGTRSGDIDPAVLLHLIRRADYRASDLDELLNKKSGLLGLAGVADMRDIVDGYERGDHAATLAFEVYIHRLRAYAGAYLAQLGGADVISFTAGVGENSAPVRAAALATLGFAGVEIDPVLNETRARGIREISTPASRVKVLIVPTNEELEIARQSLSLLP